MTDPSYGDAACARESLYGTQEEPTYSGALSFMRRKYSKQLSGVDVAVTGIPIDVATSNVEHAIGRARVALEHDHGINGTG